MIKTIIWQESTNQKNVINRKNTTVEVGMMQINSIHFKSLKKDGGHGANTACK
ncbi:transglycosylase SLT domain-containing protein [Erwinia piriflorinigrans]|uniref:transglycosylase SLT domain-containing protein n=1 Tax=Erwinia piriflorinigrans TaxID=665097 RepID=UPI001F119AB1|nr:transglycosylase SLT domain-containing protein [Erwinia piriflorinigrans]